MLVHIDFIKKKDMLFYYLDIIIYFFIF